MDGALGNTEEGTMTTAGWVKLVARETEGATDDLSLIGRKVGNRSRLPPEKLPRIDPDEVGGEGSGTGLRPDWDGWSLIPNTLAPGGRG